MNSPVDILMGARTEAGRLARGTVQAAGPDGTVVVDTPGRVPAEVVCDVLQTSEDRPLRLSPGDTVLVWLPDGDGEQGVVIGRVGPPSAPAASPDTPEVLVLRARQQVVLQCGDGSITLRGDGKILIKGKDLVSRAQRTNRIKGGSVAIN
jgi:hypothetical protein